MKKRLIALLLCLVMLLTCMGAAEGILSPESRSVGDTICIKQGTDVYQAVPEVDTAVGYSVTADVTATITEIEKDESGNDAWYKFTSTDDADGNVFCYVSASGVESVKTPEASEEPTASPSSEPTAEPTAEPTESPEPSAIPDESEKSDESTGTEKTETEKDTFTVATNGIQISAAADNGVFPEGTSISATTDSTDYSDCFSGNVLDILAVDISFWNAEIKVQPNGYVSVTMSIPAGLVPADAETFTIYHIGSAGPEKVQEYDLSAYRNGIDAYGGSTATAGGETSSDEGFVIGTASVGVKSLTPAAGEQPLNVTFAANSFSSYAVVFVGGKYPSQLLSEALKSDSTYKITTIPARLIDYDPAEMNGVLVSDAIQNKYNGQANAFQFNGYGLDYISGGKNGVNHSNTVAKQGIVANELDNSGLPVFNYVSSNTGNILFGNEEVNGKTVYDVNFQMIYNQNTGYYTYKSSANHAQLNEDTKTVELYTDTLAVASIVRENLNLSKCKGSDVNSVSNNTSYSATASGEDPYVSFKVSYGVEASEVEQIYVKMKVDPSVGKNALQLYYVGSNENQGEAESRSVCLEYTVTEDDYIEFFIDTSELDGWSDAGTLNSIRIDPFDGRSKHFSDKNYSKVNGKSFEIAQISLLGKTKEHKKQNDTDGIIWSKAGFYPFSDIGKSYPGVKASQFDITTWEKKINSNANETSLSTRSILKPNTQTSGYADDTELNENLCFALVTEFQFYIPEGKKVGDKNLTYYFNGDDDLWVFVDGKLVLDIGGGHGSITGEINFTDGTYKVEKAVEVTGYDSISGNTANGETKSGILSDLTEEGETPLDASGLHTMKIFYMERCGSVSNCYMKYNLPVVPTGDVVVSKRVDKGASTVADTKLDNKAFSFTITGEYDGNGTSSTASTDNKEDPNEFTLTQEIATNGQNPTITKIPVTGGKFELTFELKDGQTAAFSSIPENYKITVTETTTGNLDTSTHKYQRTTKTITKNGTTISEAKAKTSNGGKLNFAFTNTYELQLTDLTIKKSGWQDIDENQSFIFKVTGDGLGNGIDVVIKGNGSATIKDLQIGKTYTVTEVSSWSWRYTPNGGTTQTKTLEASDNEVTFTNKREKIKWLDGNAYCQNKFGTNAATTK